MWAPRQSLSVLLALAALSSTAAATSGDAEKTTTTTSPMPCTATTHAGSFYDLRPDIAIVEEEGTKHHKGAVIEDYKARGWDYGANFTFNLCAPVVTQVTDVVGVDRSLWKNVSAYYQSKGDIFSLGQAASELVPRGRKLVLQYTGGSPCGSLSHRARAREVSPAALAAPVSPATKRSAARAKRSEKHARVPKTKRTTSSGSGYYDDDDEEEIGDGDDGSEKSILRKSMTISFICDRDPLNTVASASFVGTDPDECAYFFEVRSQHACAGAEPQKPGTVGPGSVFAIIFFIAVLVYLVGGIMYQRTVAHARGWRQLPNYSLWAGILGFVKDFFIILTSSCLQFLPSRRGYRSLNGSPNGRGSRNRDDENRLIDQLDEDWDD